MKNGITEYPRAFVVLMLTYDSMSGEGNKEDLNLPLWHHLLSALDKDQKPKVILRVHASLSLERSCLSLLKYIFIY